MSGAISIERLPTVYGLVDACKFGVQAPSKPRRNAKRDVLEGRLLWAAHEVLGVGSSVVLDVGCWAEAERWAVRAVAEHAGGRFRLQFVDLPEVERRARATARWEGDPGSTFEMSPGDHDRFTGLFQAPTEAEIAAKHLPAPPTGHRSWLAGAANRWPSLPDFSDDPQATWPHPSAPQPVAGLRS